MPTTTFSKEFYQQQLVAGNNVTISTASGQPSTISVSGGDTFVAGNNIVLSTYSGRPTVISAVDTTYTNFYVQGPGLVPPVTTADSNSFLRGDGSWVGVDLSNHYVAGSNINISTASGQPSTISAVDTTYSAFTSSTSGLVPSPASSPANSYLKSDGSWSTISAGDSYIAGSNINISTASGQPSTISAVDTTYANFSGSTSGLVPPATVSGDSGKYLKGDGTWSTPSGGGGSGSTVSITPTLSMGTKIADFEIDGVSGELYAPSGGGGGGIIINEMDYAEFDGNGFIVLDQTINADYKITVDFDIPTYIHNMGVIGNAYGSNQYFHLTEWGDVWWVGVGASEASFNKPLTGRHIFASNDNGSNTFDGDIVTPYTPTTTNLKLAVGRSYSGSLSLVGKIYSYKIESILSGNTVVDLVPAQIVAIVGNQHVILDSGLLDKVSGKLYKSAAITVGDD